MLAMSARSDLERLLPRGRPPAATAESAIVQLSVRVPAELRDAVRETAEAAGVSATELVEHAIRAEIGRRRDPAAQFAERLATSIRERLAQALEDGSWDEAVRTFTAGDAELAS